MTLVALALVPRVQKKLGWGYALYALAAMGIPALSSKDFMGLGRYIIAAFPCFIAGADFLVRQKPWAQRAVFGASALGMVLLTIAFGAGKYVA
jgi:peptidoglycan/LPS O-acetylase OafA/YrhL